jgi:hypothetical protein
MLLQIISISLPAAMNCTAASGLSNMVLTDCMPMSSDTMTPSKAISRRRRSCAIRRDSVAGSASSRALKRM